MQKCNKPFCPIFWASTSRVNKPNYSSESGPGTKESLAQFFLIKVQLPSDVLKLQATALLFNIILRNFPRRQSRDIHWILLHTHFDRFFTIWLPLVSNILNNVIPKHLFLASLWMHSEEVYVQNVLQIVNVLNHRLASSRFWVVWNYDPHIQDR